MTPRPVSPALAGRADARYSRQVVFEGIGAEGQARLAASRTVIVGCGALGCFQAGALARAGAGYIRIIDRDYVELSNLQRQWLFDEADAEAGIPKAVAAAQRLRRVNSEIGIEPVVADLTPENAVDLLSGADVILDGTDNFETRYLINDFAVREGAPWIYGAAVGSYGLTMIILPGRNSCLKCVYPEPPGGAQPTCETAGVVNTVTAVVASLQVSAALRILTGTADTLAPRLTTVDVWTGAIRQIPQPKRTADCPACGLRQFPHLDERRRTPISLCGQNAVQIHQRERPLDLAALAARLGRLGEVRANEFALRFFVEPYQLTVFPDGRAIIKGTTDVGVARGLYAKYVGS